MESATVINSTFKPKAASGILRTAKFPKVSRKPVKRLKSNQRAVTGEEKAIWSRMAESGCIACHLDGNHNTHVSIHHIDGRTKPGCHKLTLPLCAGHHQDGTGNDKSMIAVHPYKAQFESVYGSQLTLLAEVMKRIGQ